MGKGKDSHALKSPRYLCQIPLEQLKLPPDHPWIPILRQSGWSSKSEPYSVAYYIQPGRAKCRIWSSKFHSRWESKNKRISVIKRSNKIIYVSSIVGTNFIFTFTKPDATAR